METMKKADPEKENGLIRVGIVSDTHGILTGSVLRALEGVDLILHAGDVGSREVIGGLSAVAPVNAVRGNMDGGALGRSLPPAEAVELGEVTAYILHDLLRLDLDPASAGFQVVVHGHTHRAEREKDGTVLYLNPGSASQPRHGRRATVAILEIRGKDVAARFVELDG
jgi:putative phosphoesterase